MEKIKKTRRLACVAALGMARLCLAAGIAAAQSAPMGDSAFTMSTFGGIETGTAKEFVYDGSFTESELDWNFSPFYLYGLRLDYSGRSGFFASLSLASALPGKVGIMTDSDWLYYDYGDYNKTDFSESDCYMEQAFIASASAGWLWRPQQNLQLGLFVALDYMNLEWSARDGYSQYPDDGSDWSADLAKDPLYGLGILYRQVYVIPKAGLRFVCRPAPRLTVEGSLAFSPAVSCDDEDDHLYRSIKYTESFRGGSLFEPSLSASYRLSPMSSIGLRVLYRSIQGLRGDEHLLLTQDYTVTSGGTSYTYPAGYSETYADGAGASLQCFEMTLSISVHF